MPDPKPTTKNLIVVVIEIIVGCQLSRYLSDTICIGIINSVDNTNITTNARAHTIQCMLLQYCIDSGYTIMEEVNPAGGSWATIYKVRA